MTRIVSAQPATEQAEPIPLRTVYVELGLQFGSEAGQAFVDGRLDAGYHFGRTPMWLHVGSALGGPLSFNLGGDLGDKHYVSGSLGELTGGAEARVCKSGVLCGAAGIDLGYESVVYDDMDVTIPSQSVHVKHASLVVIPRLQLDIGSSRIRFRPTLSLPISSGSSAPQLTLAMALLI